jgi:hypothetical protein
LTERKVSQVPSAVFLYDVEFEPYENPPGTCDRFGEDLRHYFASRNLTFGMSALGGTRHCRGSVFGEKDTLLDSHRQELADWIRCQRVKCVVRLGAIEENTDATKHFREITEWVFNVDTLTDDDRIQAKAYHDEIRSWIASRAK